MFSRSLSGLQPRLAVIWTLPAFLVCHLDEQLSPANPLGSGKLSPSDWISFPLIIDK